MLIEEAVKASIPSLYLTLRVIVMNAKEIIQLHQDTANRKHQITFKRLYEDVLSEVEDAAKRGQEEELMQQKIELSIVDQQGNVIQGYATLMVGWLEGGGVLITGNLLDIYPEKGVH